MSKRGYLTIQELEQYANITVTDQDEAIDQINFAEEIIDAYVGYQEKFFEGHVNGEVTSAVVQTIIDSGSSELIQTDNYFKGMTLELLSGDGAGQTRQIASSNRDNRSVTYEGDPFNPAPGGGDMFRIIQLGKFPRQKDVFLNRAGTNYAKTIPEAVRRATAAQVEYFINMGSDFFASDNGDKESESIGNYSYSKGGGVGGGQSALVKMTAPKARTLLRGIKNSTGRLIAENPTKL